MKILILTVALLMPGLASAQAWGPDVSVPSLPSQTARTWADAASWGTALVPVILDAKVSWDAPNRSRAFVLQGARIGVTYGVGFLVKKVTHRARPCAEEGCGSGTDPYGSFYSLHTALPFTAFGGQRVAIVVPFGVTTAGLRVLSGKHWLSDTLAGAGAGLLTSRIR